MSTPRTNPTEQEIQEIQAQAVGIAEGWQPYESTLDDDVVIEITPLSPIMSSSVRAAKGEQKPDCRTRQKIRASREDDKPHNKVETAKPATPIAMTLRRPNLVDIQPAKGMVTAVAIKFAVTTQAT